MKKTSTMSSMPWRLLSHFRHLSPIPAPHFHPFRLLGRTGTLPIIRPINSERCNTLCDYKPDQCTANTTLLKVYTIKLSGGCHVFSIVFSPTHNSRVRRFIQFVRLLRCAVQARRLLSGVIATHWQSLRPAREIVL